MERNWFTLAFRDPELERAYIADAAEAARWQFRLVTGGLLVAIFLLGLVDDQTGGSGANIEVMRRYRFALGLPVTVFAFAVGYLNPRWFQVLWQPVLTVWGASIVVTNTIVGATLPDPGAFDMRIGLVSLVLTASSAPLVGLRFAHAAVATLPANTFGLLVIASRWPEVLGPSIFWIAVANSFGLVLAYQLEDRHRRTFALARRLGEEQERSERLLRNVLPQPIGDRLKAGQTRIADSFPEATILFADIVGFTEHAARATPEELVRQLDEIFTEFDGLADQFGLEKIKTIGDAYMVVGGVPVPHADHVAHIADMALAIRERMLARGLGVRIGIATGPVVAGVIGKRKFIYDLWGDAVNTASRMESHGVPGEIQVTPEVYERLRAAYRLEPRGTVSVKGKGEMTTWLLRGRSIGDHLGPAAK